MTTGSIDLWEVRRSSLAARVPVALTRTRVHPAIVLGTLGAVIAWLGSWIPAFWGDEAASVMSAERSIPSLLAELGRIDAVHGLYYLFLHFWIEAFGASALAVRLPSAIAVGLATAGVVVLARQFTSPRTAIVAGVVFALLPRVTYMGAEARSYAMQAAVAVWLTVWFVKLLRAPVVRLRGWLAYGAVLGLSAYLFLYLLLLLAVHGLVLLVGPARSRLRGWLAAAALAVVVAAPIAVLANREKGQIAFLARRDYANAFSVIVDQWFGWPALAALAWILIACAVAAAVLNRRVPGPAAERTRQAVVLGLAWIAAPTALLLLGNALLSPMYNVRYLSFATPGAALLIAVGITAIPSLLERMTARRWRALTLSTEVLVLVALVAVPAYALQRTPFAKDGGSDWQQLSAAVRMAALPGDAIVFDQATKPSQRPRLAMHLYPQDYRNVRDVALITPFAERAGLWDAVRPVTELAPSLAGVDRVLAVELRGTSTPADIRSLERDGYQVSDVDHLHRTDLYTLIREDS